MKLQSFLRATAALRREQVRVPPFTAYFDPADPIVWFNYAIPDDGAEPDGAAIDALRAAFEQRARRPRLEWIEEAAPAVAAVLEAAGMTEELRTPLMTCDPEQLREPELALPGLTVAPITDSDLREMRKLQAVAFEQDPLPPDEQPRDPRATGAGAVIARIDGEAAAAAIWTPIIDGVSEIVGVATVDKFRRRGLPGAVTAAATRGAFEAGASLCVLSPGNETAMRVYERAGFTRAATMLHWSDQP